MVCTPVACQARLSESNLCRRRTARQPGGGASVVAPSIGGSAGKRFCGATRRRRVWQSAPIREGMFRLPPELSLAASKVEFISSARRLTAPQRPCAVFSQQEIPCLREPQVSAVPRKRWQVHVLCWLRQQRILILELDHLTQRASNSMHASSGPST